MNDVGWFCFGRNGTAIPALRNCATGFCFEPSMTHCGGQLRTPLSLSRKTGIGSRCLNFVTPILNQDSYSNFEEEDVSVGSSGANAKIHDACMEAHKTSKERDATRIE